MSPILSVIIPVYNGSSTINKCVLSIIAECTSKFEIIIVDDGSTDDTAMICRSLTKRYKNVNYYYQKNAGPGAARNLGVKLSKGKYVSFVDSDDFVSSNYINVILNTISKNNENIDIICFNFKVLENKIFKKRKQILKNDFPIIKESDTKDLIKNIYNEAIGNFCWQFVFKREKLDLVSFDSNNKMLEDAVYLNKILRIYRSVVYIHSPLYIYCINKNSLTQNINKYSDQALNSIINIFKITLQDQTTKYYIPHAISLIFFAYTPQNKDKIKKMLKTFLSYNKRIDLIYKIKCLFVFLNIYDIYLSIRRNK